MRIIRFEHILITGLILGVNVVCFSNGLDAKSPQSNKPSESTILSYIVNPRKQRLKFYLKDKNGHRYSSFKRLKSKLAQQNETLIFATNGGIYNQNRLPQGLYIENGIILSPIDSRKDSYGNFYLQPNGILSVTEEGKSFVTTTRNYVTRTDISNGNVKYATQSGPMLLIEGKLHSKFKKGSKNTHIRNGVGILPDGNLLFAISKLKINFYNFALYFKKQGCENALYLDGFVSKTYLPSKRWNQLDGNFAVIIAETKHK